jgi:hypothetical protein
VPDSQTGGGWAALVGAASATMTNHGTVISQVESSNNNFLEGNPVAGIPAPNPARAHPARVRFRRSTGAGLSDSADKSRYDGHRAPRAERLVSRGAVDQTRRVSASDGGGTA